MTNTLQRVDSSVDAQRMAQILDADGALIVTDALTPRQLRQVNGEVDDMMQATAPGLRHPTTDFYVGFYGARTIRRDGLPAKSTTFVELMDDSFMTRVADELLLPNCSDYLLNTGQLIQIGPGETVLTRIPWGPSSAARFRTRAMSASFEML